MLEIDFVCNSTIAIPGPILLAVLHEDEEVATSPNININRFASVGLPIVRYINPPITIVLSPTYHRRSVLHADFCLLKIERCIFQVMRLLFEKKESVSRVLLYILGHEAVSKVLREYTFVFWIIKSSAIYNGKKTTIRLFSLLEWYNHIIF